MVDTRMDFDLGLYLIREQRYMGLENHKLRAINSNDFLPVHVLHLTWQFEQIVMLSGVTPSAWARV